MLPLSPYRVGASPAQEPADERVVAPKPALPDWPALPEGPGQPRPLIRRTASGGLLRAPRAALERLAGLRADEPRPALPQPGTVASSGHDHDVLQGVEAAHGPLQVAPAGPAPELAPPVDDDVPLEEDHPLRRPELAGISLDHVFRDWCLPQSPAAGTEWSAPGLFIDQMGRDMGADVAHLLSRSFAEAGQGQPAGAGGEAPLLGSLRAYADRLSRDPEARKWLANVVSDADAACDARASVSLGTLVLAGFLQDMHDPATPPGQAVGTLVFYGAMKALEVQVRELVGPHGVPSAELLTAAFHTVQEDLHARGVPVPAVLARHNLTFQADDHLTEPAMNLARGLVEQCLGPADEAGPSDTFGTLPIRPVGTRLAQLLREHAGQECEQLLASRLAHRVGLALAPLDARMDALEEQLGAGTLAEADYLAGCNELKAGRRQAEDRVLAHTLNDALMGSGSTWSPQERPMSPKLGLRTVPVEPEPQEAAAKLTRSYSGTLRTPSLARPDTLEPSSLARGKSTPEPSSLPGFLVGGPWVRYEPLTAPPPPDGVPSLQQVAAEICRPGSAAARFDWSAPRLFVDHLGQDIGQAVAGLLAAGFAAVAQTPQAIVKGVRMPTALEALQGYMERLAVSAAVRHELAYDAARHWLGCPLPEAEAWSKLIIGNRLTVHNMEHAHGGDLADDVGFARLAAVASLSAAAAVPQLPHGGAAIRAAAEHLLEQGLQARGLPVPSARPFHPFDPRDTQLAAIIEETIDQVVGPYGEGRLPPAAIDLPRLPGPVLLQRLKDRWPDRPWVSMLLAPYLPKALAAAPAEAQAREAVYARAINVGMIGHGTMWQPLERPDGGKSLRQAMDSFCAPDSKAARFDWSTPGLFVCPRTGRDEARAVAGLLKAVAEQARIEPPVHVKGEALPSMMQMLQTIADCLADDARGPRRRQIFTRTASFTEEVLAHCLPEQRDPFVKLCIGSCLRDVAFMYLRETDDLGTAKLAGRALSAIGKEATSQARQQDSSLGEGAVAAILSRVSEELRARGLRVPPIFPSYPMDAPGVQGVRATVESAVQAAVRHFLEPDPAAGMTPGRHLLKSLGGGPSIRVFLDEELGPHLTTDLKAAGPSAAAKEDVYARAFDDALTGQGRMWKAARLGDGERLRNVVHAICAPGSVAAHFDWSAPGLLVNGRGQDMAHDVQRLLGYAELCTGEALPTEAGGRQVQTMGRLLHTLLNRLADDAQLRSLIAQQADELAAREGTPCDGEMAAKFHVGNCLHVLADEDIRQNDRRGTAKLAMLVLESVLASAGMDLPAFCDTYDQGIEGTVAMRRLVEEELRGCGLEVPCIFPNLSYEPKEADQIQQAVKDAAAWIVGPLQDAAQELPGGAAPPGGRGRQVLEQLLQAGLGLDTIEDRLGPHLRHALQQAQGDEEARKAVYARAIEDAVLGNGAMWRSPAPRAG